MSQGRILLLMRFRSSKKSNMRRFAAIVLATRLRALCARQKDLIRLLRREEELLRQKVQTERAISTIGRTFHMHRVTSL